MKYTNCRLGQVFSICAVVLSLLALAPPLYGTGSRDTALPDGNFRGLADRDPGGLFIDAIDTGPYRADMDLPLGGYALKSPLVLADGAGTVKFGDFSRTWEPFWSVRFSRRLVFDTSLCIIIGILVFCFTGLIASVRGMGAVMAEGAAMRLDARALVRGAFLPSEKKKRLTKLKKRGMGLRLKLASFTIILVLLVVVMVSVPLYVIMTRTQQETLLQGLWDRSTVLLEGLASSVRAYLSSQNSLEMGYLPTQTSAIPEARYVTITGFNPDTAIFDDQVWATNDPDILSKIDTPELEAGVSYLDDVLSFRLQRVADDLNERARSEVGALSTSIANLNQEVSSQAFRTDEDSIQRLSDIQTGIRYMESRLNERLEEIARYIGSEPAFSTTALPADGNHTFLFFRPVMYRAGTEDTYLRGLIRLEVSIDSILEQIAREQQSLLGVILVVALSAIAIGVVGALILSTLIIRPIRKLMAHVELLRDTEDKSRLEGVDILIKSQDEIAILGNTINDMTHGLVKAAQASQDLIIGKEIQKKFIPLDTDRDGNKLTSGFEDTRSVRFFGYYEGAKGVSGDYFDYQNLDGRYYAIIKCDVAGKGIPASLIMIQVATMFLNYFKQWKPTDKGMHIEELVYQINDFIEALGFEGRFAAFTLCLFDSETGIVRFCNAGDNIIHWFDASERKMKTLTLRETPAAGVLPNSMVETKGGYTVQIVNIGKGDILFLYTDGIEESKCTFRDEDYKEIICTEGPIGALHANHASGQGDEAMGSVRVEAIINAVMNRQLYTLHKWHNPAGGTDLQFDFTNCAGTVEEAIMAMVSVEKMFRLYRDPRADADARVLVDKSIDAFLRDHFIQYRTYCSYTREFSENDTYMYYTHVKEDTQYDDLTIIGINRK